MFNENTLSTLITVIGGVGTAYIINVVAKRVQRKRPKDRTELIFDGYERIIRQKDKQLEQAAMLIDAVQKQLDDTTKAFEKLRQDLEAERASSKELRHQIEELRRQLDEGNEGITLEPLAKA